MRLSQKFESRRPALTCFTLLCAVVAVFISTTLLTEVRSEDRIWTNSTGQELEAELVEVGDGQVQLRSAKDGQIYPYELSNLSKKDQVFIALLESKPPPLDENATTMELFIAPYVAMGFRVVLETTLILLIANSIGLYLCSKVLSRDRDRVKFSAALLITILALAIMNIGFDFPRAFAAAKRDLALFTGIASFSVVLLFFGGLFLTSTLLTDGWIRALGVWIASILLFAFPAALLYQHVLVGEETAARIERSGQIADQIFMRAMGGEEDAAEKSR